MTDSALEREILRPLWKVHVLHHAAEGRLVGHWMLEELRKHGYRVSPGTLYPQLARMERLGWLRQTKMPRAPGAKAARPYRLTAKGRQALKQVNARLRELLAEVFPSSPAP